MTIDKLAFANRLRQFIISKNWKNKDLAEALGISQSSLQSNYLSGNSIPGAEILFNLEELGCDIIWLISGKDSRVLELEKRNKELELQVKDRDARIEKLHITIGQLIEKTEARLNKIKASKHIKEDEEDEETKARYERVRKKYPINLDEIKNSF